MANYRYKMSFPQPDSETNKCSTLIVGVGILLAMASLAFFGKVSIHGYTLTYVCFLAALNFLSYHAKILRIIIALTSSCVGLYLVVSALPDFVSSSIVRSQLGFYYMFVGFYSLGVSYCQFKTLTK